MSGNLRQITGHGASVELCRVRKAYGDAVAVDDVELSIEAGEFVTLLGASGSGKTTLLRIIAGFLDADSGAVLVDGQDIGDLPVHKRDIGMVFQSYALFPHMSVSKNVAYPLRMRGVARAEAAEKVAAALAAVRMEKFSERRPSQLSGGQQQRVALARAIVAQPRILLMDEPLGALDRNLREELQIEIGRLSRELGLTVINVTHDQEEALTMSDRIALLKDGRLLQFAPPRELYGAPVNVEVAEFIGESTIFRGVVDDGSLVLDGLHRIPLPPVREDSLRRGRAALVVRTSVVTVTSADVAADRAWIEGRVDGFVYVGDDRKVLITASSGEQVVAREPAGAPSDLEVGSPVHVSWAPEDAYLTRSTSDDGETAHVD